jgi:hypothetical protein
MKQKPALYVTIQEQIPLNYNRVGRPWYIPWSKRSSASNAAIEILNSSVQAIQKSPIEKQLARKIKKITSVIKKLQLRMLARENKEHAPSSTDS